MNNKTWVRLRPVLDGDLAMFRRFATEPGLAGAAWTGYHEPNGPARRFAHDGYLGAEDGRLMVEADETAAGYVHWFAIGSGMSQYWGVGIVLLPEWRGRGVGWRAQTLLCDYLFASTPAQRVEARVQPENIAEQKALEKVGFLSEGILRSAEFRDGAWRDVLVYGRLRGDR
ncbi:GNAT family N-acetyltransferase [Dactylosporangium darangshiense]|uniref:N-acetyltransferase domain-containing protein n=1 Tax=Dactylosporangium darangshiense TaxID=579108 RepID=A0ABP8DL51_9ACTN